MLRYSIFILLIFSLFIQFSYQNEEELASILKLSAGIYTNESRINDYSSYAAQLRKTVLLTAGNNAYMNHMHNFVCFLQRLGMKALALAVDDHSFNHMNDMRKNKDSMTETLYTYRLRGKDRVWGMNANFRSPQFHIISMLKIEGALQVLRQGYDVFFVDPDVAMIRDPIKDLLWKNVDYIHSVNLRCNISEPAWRFYETEQEGNTGFYLLRSNVRTISLLEKVIKKAPSMRGYDDQTIFWRGLRQGEFGPVHPLPTCQDYFNSTLDINTLVTCPLDKCQFSSGALAEWDENIMYKLLLEALRDMKKPLMAVHANYIVGNPKKTEMLKQKGFWITQWPDSDTCLQYTRKFP